METRHNSKRLGIIIGVLAVLVVGIVSVFAGRKDISTAETIVPSTMVTPSDIKKLSTYKDGNYSAIGSYMSPGGLDKVGVAVVLDKDIITEIIVSPMGGNETSDKYLETFVKSYKTFVVGKSITDLKLGKVSGASLTPIGFNDAIEQIKLQAKA